MKAKNILFKLFIIFVLLLTGCSDEPTIDNTTMLDGDQVFDASIYNH